MAQLTQLLRRVVLLEIIRKFHLYMLGVLLDINAIVSNIKWQDQSIRQGHCYLGPHPRCHLMVFKFGVNHC